MMHTSASQGNFTNQPLSVVKYATKLVKHIETNMAPSFDMFSFLKSSLFFKRRRTEMTFEIAHTTKMVSMQRHICHPHLIIILELAHLTSISAALKIWSMLPRVLLTICFIKIYYQLILLYEFVLWGKPIRYIWQSYYK